MNNLYIDKLEQGIKLLFKYSLNLSCLIMAIKKKLLLKSLD